jgi:hypothetical protein
VGGVGPPPAQSAEPSIIVIPAVSKSPQGAPDGIERTPTDTLAIQPPLIFGAACELLNTRLRLLSTARRFW